MHKHIPTKHIANGIQQLSRASKYIKKEQHKRWWSVDKKLKSRSTIKFIASIQSNQEQQEKRGSNKSCKCLTNQWLKPYPQLMKVDTKKTKQQINNNIDDDDDDNNEIHLSTLMNLNYVVITVRINKKKRGTCDSHRIFHISRQLPSTAHSKLRMKRHWSFYNIKLTIFIAKNKSSVW